MKRANRPVPIVVPKGEAAAANFKLTDSGVWSEGGLVFSNAGCIINNSTSNPVALEDSTHQQRAYSFADMTDGRLPSESIQKGDIGACDQACDQDNTLSAPTPPAVSRSQANNSNTSTNSTSHTGCLGTPSTAAQPPVQNGTSSSNSSPSSSTVALCDLQELAIIGSGSSGVVKKVLHKPSQQAYVLKVINLDMGSQQVRRQVMREVRALDGARHPHVVAYHQSFFAEGAVTILMEFMDGGTLWDLLQKIRAVPEPYLAELTHQMLLGLSFLHETARICHRDVKPSNLLLSSSGQLKISDFGTSSQLSNSMSKCLSWVGTVTYMSPERIKGDCYSFNTDVWSLGLLVLECALGRYPYPPQQQQVTGSDAPVAALPPQKLGFWELLEYIVVEPAPRLPAGQFSAELVDFVSQCLQKDASRRPSAQKLLHHPFVVRSQASKVSLSDLLKLPAVRQSQQHGAAGRAGNSALRRSGSSGGVRGSVGGGALGVGVFRQSGLGPAGLREGHNSWTSAGPVVPQRHAMASKPLLMQVQASTATAAVPTRSTITASAAIAAPCQASDRVDPGNTAALVSSSNSSRTQQDALQRKATQASAGISAAALPEIPEQASPYAGLSTAATAVAELTVAESPSSGGSSPPVMSVTPASCGSLPQPFASTTSVVTQQAMASPSPSSLAATATAAAVAADSSPLLSGQMLRRSTMSAGVARRQTKQGWLDQQQQQQYLEHQLQQSGPMQQAQLRQSMQQLQASVRGPLQQHQHQQQQQQQQQQQSLSSLVGQQQRLHHPVLRQLSASTQLQVNEQPTRSTAQSRHHQQQQQQRQSLANSPQAAAAQGPPQAPAMDAAADLPRHRPAMGCMTPQRQQPATGALLCSPQVTRGPLTALKPSISRRLHEAS